MIYFVFEIIAHVRTFILLLFNHQDIITNYQNQPLLFSNDMFDIPEKVLSLSTVLDFDNYSEEIDFDASSSAWRANKIYIGNGEFTYVPEAPRAKNRNKKDKEEDFPIENKPQHRYNLRSKARANRVNYLIK